MHDTSVTTLEHTYARHISHFADAVLRGGLLDTAQPNQDNVVNLRGR
jgi:hypothetical protein